MKNVDNILLQKEAITKSTPLAVSKDEWKTKKATGKSMKNGVVHTAVCQKAPLGQKRC